MHALVTGAAGFIGSHLCAALLERGWQVAGIDDLSSGCMDNLSSIAGRLAFWRADVASLADVDVGPVDVIFHLAARVGPDYVVRDRLTLLRQHSASTLAVLAVAERTDARVVLASTSEVYGCSVAIPFSESQDLVLGESSHPRWAYAVSKLWCEHAILGWGQSHPGKSVIARLFNTVGPRQSADSGLVLPSFARAALGGSPLRVHGDGAQRRSFVHVEDAADALIALARCDRARELIVNVGCAYDRSILSVARDFDEHARTRYGRGSRIDFVPWNEIPGRPSRMEVRSADTRRLRELTGIVIPDRWERIVADVSAWEAAALGLETVASARSL